MKYSETIFLLLGSQAQIRDRDKRRRRKRSYTKPIETEKMHMNPTISYDASRKRPYETTDKKDLLILLERKDVKASQASYASQDANPTFCITYLLCKAKLKFVHPACGCSPSNQPCLPNQLLHLQSLGHILGQRFWLQDSTKRSPSLKLVCHRPSEVSRILQHWISSSSLKSVRNLTPEKAGTSSCLPKRGKQEIREYLYLRKNQTEWFRTNACPKECNRIRYQATASLGLGIRPPSNAWSANFRGQHCFNLARMNDFESFWIIESCSGLKKLKGLRAARARSKGSM